MSIQERIEAIKLKRKNIFLPKIEEKLKFIDELERQIKEVETLTSDIKMQCDKHMGVYYNILANDPGMELRLQQVSTEEVGRLLYETRVELMRLKKRFLRSSVSLQVFGMAGNGKSTFIQSITGLTNDVVLASEGNHVTGVSSFIYNSDHFETRVYLYTKSEILDIFNNSLKYLAEKAHLKEEPELLRDYNAIKTFSLTDAGIPEDQVERFCVLKYVNNFDLITKLLSGKDEQGNPLEGFNTDNTGRYYVEIHNPAEVQQWVAQHNGHHESDPEYRPYMRFLAVNHVDIYKNFVFEDAGDVVLMDTVGLGNDDTDVSTMENIYQSIADNSDAVIVLYKPGSNSAWRGEIKNVNERIKSIRYDEEGNDRTDINELYIVLNRINNSKADNTEDCPEVVNTFKKVPYERKETILVANASDKDSVRADAIEPILVQLTDNLESIDARKVEKANDLGQRLYIAYSSMVKNIESVISGKMKMGSDEMSEFRRLYKHSLDYSDQLRVLEKKYECVKDKPCTEVKESIDECIDNLIELISTPEEIVTDIKKGVNNTNVIFQKYVNLFRIKIYETFSELNINVLLPLQNKVIDSVIEILYTNAKFGNIILSNPDIEGPSQEWLSCFINEKVDKERYPRLYMVLHYILDYHINIQGLIEYNLAKSISKIDIHSKDFQVMQNIVGVDDEEHSELIWDEIVNRTTYIQEKMRQWRNDFSLIPSHSFYARVSMFRDMIIQNDFTEEELCDFYSENRIAIWRDEFAAMTQQTEAFGNWNGLVKDVSVLCNKNNFIVTLNK